MLALYSDSTSFLLPSEFDQHSSSAQVHLWPRYLRLPVLEHSAPLQPPDSIRGPSVFISRSILLPDTSWHPPLLSTPGRLLFVVASVSWRKLTAGRTASLSGNPSPSLELLLKGSRNIGGTQRHNGASPRTCGFCKRQILKPLWSHPPKSQLEWMMHVRQSRVPYSVRFWPASVQTKVWCIVCCRQTNSSYLRNRFQVRSSQTESSPLVLHDLSCFAERQLCKKKYSLLHLPHNDDVFCIAYL